MLAVSSACTHAHTMIPLVWMDPVWGRAQTGPVQLVGYTGPSPTLAVLDWTGLVWTGLNRVVFINFKVDRKTKDLRW
jgi:hypothetical protein